MALTPVATDPNAVKAAFNRLLMTEFQHSRWISPANRYYSAPDVSALISAEGPNNFNGGELAEYLAASVLLHCFDGWQYLAHAIASALTGDVRASIHMAYYGEVRAVKAILARQGVGVFNRTHVGLTSGGAQMFNSHSGTHVFLAQALQQWLATRGNAGRILGMISAYAKPISSWLVDAGLGHATGGQLAHALLSAWSIDVLKLKRDKDLRNDVSYNPSAISGRHIATCPFEDRVDMVKRLWLGWEPRIASNFAGIDVELLGVALRRAAASVGVAFDESLVERGAASLRKPLGKTEIAEILGPGKIVSETSAAEPNGILARATLLLRVATSSVQDLLDPVAESRAALEFWWSSVGEAAGLWSSGANRPNLADIWGDIDLALTQLDGWDPATDNSLYFLQQRFARDLWSLTKVQGPALWGAFGAV